MTIVCCLADSCRQKVANILSALVTFVILITGSPFLTKTSELQLCVQDPKKSLVMVGLVSYLKFLFGLICGRWTESLCDKFESVNCTMFVCSESMRGSRRMSRATWGSLWALRGKDDPPLFHIPSAHWPSGVSLIKTLPRPIWLCRCCFTTKFIFD